MERIKRIEALLDSIDRKDYGSYQALKGQYTFSRFSLSIDRIPKDPYAPSFTGLYKVRFDRSYTFVPEKIPPGSIEETAYTDFIARCFFRVCSEISSVRGTGNSGLIAIAEPGQTILRRNSVIMSDSSVEIRLFLGLPAEGRIILGDLALQMLLLELPEIVKKAACFDNFDRAGCLRHIETAVRSERLRRELKRHRLVGFVADGSILPRESGSSDRPMAADQAVPFLSPPSLSVGLELPDGTTVRGMGIPEGITLIVGGGYHGKSTLLQALSMGVYNHIAGDGRERVVAISGALKMRSYSGRSVKKVDISPFINQLPSGNDTRQFSTENASGSTSQAAVLMEAVESGAEVLLMDEDTCASNFMIRDALMQQLVSKSDEPITPFIDRAVRIYRDREISSVLVMGGSGDYFGISTTVIQMKSYVPVDVTERARSIYGSNAKGRITEGEPCSFDIAGRVLLKGSIDPLNSYGKNSVYARETHRINFGKEVIDLSDMEQLVEISQTKAIMEALQVLMDDIDGKKTLTELLDAMEDKIGTGGLDSLSQRTTGYLAEFRRLELAGALNRLRSLKIQ